MDAASTTLYHIYSSSPENSTLETFPDTCTFRSVVSNSWLTAVRVREYTVIIPFLSADKGGDQVADRAVELTVLRV